MDLIVLAPVTKTSLFNYEKENDFFESGGARWSGSVSKNQKQNELAKKIKYFGFFRKNKKENYNNIEIFEITDVKDNESYYREHWTNLDKKPNILILSKKLFDLPIDLYNKINYPDSVGIISMQGTGHRKFNFDKTIKELEEEFSDSDSEYYSSDFESYSEFDSESDDDESDTDDNIELNELLDDNSKFTILIKPCQSGKTQHIINEIKKSNESNKKTISFVDNSILQNDQFLTRVRNNNIKNIFTVSNRDTKLDNNALINIAIRLTNKQLLTEPYNNIIGCSNYKQIDNIYAILKLIEKLEVDIELDLYIDEIDNNFSLFQRIPEISESMENEQEISNLNSETFLDYCERSKNINRIFFITATPKKVFDYFQTNNKKLKLHYLQQTIDGNYFKFQDSKFTLYRKTNRKKYMGFVKQILDKNKLSKKSNLFCPSKVSKKDHIKIKDLLVKNNFSVLVINSDGKIFYKKKKRYDISKEFGVDIEGKELSKIISIIYKKFSLKDKKFAITGSICIGRGITINSPEFMITDAIYGDFLLSNHDKTVQVTARICGNYKNWENYSEEKKVKVFCSKKIYKKVCALENTTIKYVPTYYDEEENHLDRFDNLSKIYNNEINEDLDLLKIEIYDTTFYGNINYLKTNIKKFKKKYGLSSTFKDKKKDGMYLTSISGKLRVYQYDELMAELGGHGSKSNLDFSKSVKIGTKRSRVYLTYRNIDDLESLCAYVKIGKVIDIKEEKHEIID